LFLKQKTRDESAPVEIFVTDPHKYPGQVLKMTLLDEGAIVPEYVHRVQDDTDDGPRNPNSGDKRHLTKSYNLLVFKKSSVAQPYLFYATLCKKSDVALGLVCTLLMRKQTF
jgi:hypothetical protein